jgi:putative ABC transport system ATP-binding protein
MTVIRTVELEKTYDETGIPVHAVSDVNLRFESGEFSAIVGPSGSGKTTLLNLIGGLDRPSRGTVWIGDTDITAMPGGLLTRFRLDFIGFVFQAYNLIPVLSARENVEFILFLQHVPAGERRRRAMELLEEIGMGGKADRRPLELSGGEQQRVAVARALASRPRFILADEPTANLDTASAHNLLDLMARLNAEHEMTFLFSTHDFRVIERARRVITLCDGTVTKDEMRHAHN